MTAGLLGYRLWGGSVLGLLVSMLPLLTSPALLLAVISAASSGLLLILSILMRAAASVPLSLLSGLRSLLVPVFMLSPMPPLRDLSRPSSRPARYPPSCMTLPSLGLVVATLPPSVLLVLVLGSRPPRLPRSLTSPRPSSALPCGAVFACLSGTRLGLQSLRRGSGQVG